MTPSLNINPKQQKSWLEACTADKAFSNVEKTVFKCCILWEPL